jgi:hypothetical protein
VKNEDAVQERERCAKANNPLSASIETWDRGRKQIPKLMDESNCNFSIHRASIAPAYKKKIEDVVSKRERPNKTDARVPIITGLQTNPLQT